MLLEDNEVKLFNVYFPKELHREIKSRAASLEVTMNDFIVEAMANFIKTTFNSKQEEELPESNH